MYTTEQYKLMKADFRRLCKDMGRMTESRDEALRVIAQERAEKDALKADYQQCCLLVANMHLAAMGGVIGPVRGVVEDVQDLRSERDALQAEIENIKSHIARTTAAVIKKQHEEWRQERDALVLQNQTMREALGVVHAQLIDGKLFTQQMHQRPYWRYSVSACLAFPDLSAEVIKRIKAGVLRKAAQDMRQADCDWPAVVRLNAIAEEMEQTK